MARLLIAQDVAEYYITLASACYECLIARVTILIEYN